MRHTICMLVAAVLVVGVASRAEAQATVQIDIPSQESTVRQPFVVAGWALDTHVGSGTGVDAIHVWAYPNPGSGQPAIFLGAAAYGGNRPDVGAAFGDSRFTPSGYGLTATGLAPGYYQVVVFARTAGTESWTSAWVNVTVPAPDPHIQIDLPLAGSTVPVPFGVTGWAIDTQSGGTGMDSVEVWVYPNPGSGQPGIDQGAAYYGGGRPDVGAAFGDGRFTPSGYGLTVTLAPGTYRIEVRARSVGTGIWSSASVTITVPTSDPRMGINTPADWASVTQPFTASGWAIDRGSAGPGMDVVHVWAYPNPGSGQAAVFLGAATYGLSRPDVGAAFGSGYTNSGFSLTVSGQPPGVYNIIIYARSTVTGTWAMAMTRTVVVDLPTATLRVDRPGTGTGAVRASVSGLSCNGGAGTQAVPCAATWPYGTTVTLTAEPDAGQVFAGWGGSCGGTGTCSVTMDGTRLVVATFTAPTAVVKYYHTDAFGSVRVVTDAQGQEVVRHDFMPFGEEVNAPTPPDPADKRLFAGKERDLETGLDAFDARYLRGGIGRFTSADPVAFDPAMAADPQLFNAYAYARNNPLRWSDPTGEFPVLFWMGSPFGANAPADGSNPLGAAVWTNGWPSGAGPSLRHP